MRWHTIRRPLNIVLRVGGLMILIACFLAGGRWSGHIDGAWAHSGFDFANGATGFVLGAVLLGLLVLVVQVVSFIVRRVRGIF